MDLVNTTIKIKKVKYNAKNGYYVFDAVTVKMMPRKKIFRETKENITYCGFFPSLTVGDIFEIEYVTMPSKLYGEKNEVRSHKRLILAVESEIRAYLLSRKRGLGEVRVDRLLKKYGLDVIEKIREDETVLTSIGVPSDDAKVIRNQLLLEETYEETLTFLQMCDIDYSYALKLYTKYQENTLLVIKTSPYTPYMDGIYTFFEADKIHGFLKKPASESVRIAMCVLASLRMLARSRGDLYVDRTNVKALLRVFFDRFVDSHDIPLLESITEDDIEAAIDFLEEKYYIVCDSILRKGHTLIYLKDFHMAETRVAELLYTLTTDVKSSYFDEDEVNEFLDHYTENVMSLSKRQQKAVKKALSSPVFILTGGPGTGKTQTINAIISAIETLSDSTILLTAPTGKAANRMAELTGKEAKTIHRLLGYNPFNPKEKPVPLTADFVIVDEVSMVDIELMYTLLSVIPPTGRLILVGDADQLPPVGAGLPLKDFLDCGWIETVALKKIFRQKKDSNILYNARVSITGEGELKYGSDFAFLRCKSSNVKEVLEKEVEALLSENYDLSEVQVLTPLKGSENGVYSLNVFFQDAFNNDKKHPSYFYKDKEFRLYDRVIHTVNNYDLNVFNGETGIITDIDYTEKKAIEVTYPDKSVWYSQSDIEELELAYALSVHKAQGSEFPIVILPVTKSLSRGLYRAVLYTAITRAKEKVILVGSEKEFYNAIQREQKKERRSGLKWRIEREFSDD